MPDHVIIMNDKEIILFEHKKNLLNIVDVCIMLIMLVIGILVYPGDVISALQCC